MYSCFFCKVFVFCCFIEPWISNEPCKPGSTNVFTDTNNYCVIRYKRPGTPTIYSSICCTLETITPQTMCSSFIFHIRKLIRANRNNKKINLHTDSSQVRVLCEFPTIRPCLPSPITPTVDCPCQYILIPFITTPGLPTPEWVFQLEAWYAHHGDEPWIRQLCRRNRPWHSIFFWLKNKS